MKYRSVITPEIHKKIREIEFYTRRITSTALMGDSRSALKGTGFEFHQIREYLLGDDIRFIDWHASARMNNILVKEYREERSRTVIIALDISASMFYASDVMNKYEIATKIAVILSLITYYGNDQLGLILFSDTLEWYIPPRSGQAHIYMIIEQILSVKPAHKKTAVNVAIDKLLSIKQKNAVVFLISDYIDDVLEKTMAIAAKVYDMIALRCLSNFEQKAPAVGFLTTIDCETDEQIELNWTKKNNKKIEYLLKERVEKQNNMCKKWNIDLFEVRDNDTCITDLIRFFRRRMCY